MIKFATLFSGGGILDHGAIEGGAELLWGVECDKAIANLHRLNFPDSQLLVERVEKIDCCGLPTPDWLHASPSCKNYSNANISRQEGGEDIESAIAITKILENHQPRFFTLENVGNYRNSTAYKKICYCLSELNYKIEAETIDFSEYGIPQNRRRWFCRAYKDHPFPLSDKIEHSGWFKAIEDLIPQFAETELIQTQRDRLIEKGLSAYLTPATRQNLPPILIKRIQIRKHLCTPTPEQASFTITAGLTTDSKPKPGNRKNFVNLIMPGKILAINTRALARIQGVSDRYKLLGTSAVDGVAIGNGVPSLFIKNSIRKLYDDLRNQRF